MCPLKQCKICEKYVYFKNFSISHIGKTKITYRNHCHACRKLTRKENKETAAEYRENNRIALRAASRKWRNEHLEQAKATSRASAKRWARANREKYNAYLRSRYAKDPKRYAAYARAWQKKNPATVNARSRKRELLKTQRCPKWLTKQQHQEIGHWYKLAKEIQWLSEEKLHVDHIIPLNGKNVSGLHVPWNLQILPQTMNIKKSNKII